MTSENFSTAFKTVKKVYSGKSFADWLLSFFSNPPKESEFLKAMTTWVVRNFKARRKGGVPVGQLEKFCYKDGDGQKVDFVRHLAYHLIKILTKRGLREVDERAKSDLLGKLDEAFRRAQKS